MTARTEIDVVINDNETRTEAMEAVLREYAPGAKTLAYELVEESGPAGGHPVFAVFGAKDEVEAFEGRWHQ